MSSSEGREYLKNPDSCRVSGNESRTNKTFQRPPAFKF